ncbi:MAG: Maf family protein [Eubacteriales bacterium]
MQDNNASIYKNGRLILASSSPRRREILSLMGYNFTVVPTDADETVDSSLPPDVIVKTLARRKFDALADVGSGALNAQTDADSAASRDITGGVAVAADTIVWLPDSENGGGNVLGKPNTRARAYEMLRALSGRIHSVWTGVCVGKTGGADGEPYAFAVKTDVIFRELSDAEIYAYIDGERPYDKAGAYGIQGGAGIFITGIIGDYYNVMGLPASALYVVLRDRFGF